MFFGLIINTNRFFLRPLEKKDVTERYAQWLTDDISGRYICNKHRLPELQNYVAEKQSIPSVMFLGIFHKISGAHIGNIKYEPVDSEFGYAVMGILIGEADWRGQGVAKEVILASAFWLFKFRNIRKIVLGVSRGNYQAIKAYQKIGFIEAATEYIAEVSADGLTMVLDLNSLQHSSIN